MERKHSCTCNMTSVCKMKKKIFKDPNKSVTANIYKKSYDEQTD